MTEQADMNAVPPALASSVVGLPDPDPGRASEPDRMSQLNTLLDGGFRWMVFPPQLEEQFLRDGMPSRLRHFLISGLISLVIYNGFLLVDYLMARDVFSLAVELRLGFFTPISLSLLYLAWRRPQWVVRQLSPAAVEGVVLASGLTAAASLAYILSSTRSEYAHFYHVGFIVVMIYGNVVQRLRFWYAAVLSISLAAIHVVGVIVLPQFPQRLLWPIVSLVSSTALFTLSANYLMERDERRRYLLTLRERLLIEDLTRAHERLKELSRIDSLTGLHNRRHFQEYLEQIWARAQYDQHNMCILMVDVDHFKKYNDRYGHPAGDDCLKALAQVLKTHLRSPGDLIARYGGEEFIAVMPNTELHHAVMVAERIREALENLHIRHESSNASRVLTISIGVSCTRAGFDKITTGLVSGADAALYQAKREGRNRVCAQIVG